MPSIWPEKILMKSAESALTVSLAAGAMPWVERALAILDGDDPIRRLCSGQVELDGRINAGRFLRDKRAPMRAMNSEIVGSGMINLLI